MANKQRYTTKSGIDNNSNTIVNVADPVNPTDAATKSYVDGYYATTFYNFSLANQTFSPDFTSANFKPSTTFTMFGTGTINMPACYGGPANLNYCIVNIVNVGTSLTVTLPGKPAIVLDSQASMVLLADISSGWVILQRSSPRVVDRANDIAINAIMKISATGTIDTKRGTLNVTCQKLSTGTYRITADSYAGDTISAIPTLVSPTFVGQIYTGNYTANTVDVFIKNVSGVFQDCAFNILISYKTVL